MVSRWAEVNSALWWDVSENIAGVVHLVQVLPEYYPSANVWAVYHSKAGDVSADNGGNFYASILPSTTRIFHWSMLIVIPIIGLISG